MFNRNLRYFCEKEGLSQQRLADIMGVKRGKVAGYFYQTSPKKEFQDRFASKFGLDLPRFLTTEMDEDNYLSFFTAKEESTQVAEDREVYKTKSMLIDLLIQAKKSDDQQEMHRLIDEAIRLYGKVLDENDRLKNIISELKDRLLEDKGKNDSD